MSTDAPARDQTTPRVHAPAPRVRFLDLGVPDAERAELLAAIDRVLAHGQLVIGPEVEAFEQRVAQRCGARFAVGVSSGTCALYFALRAMGIGAGDEVITGAMSFIATANAVAMTGAAPVFADLADDLNLDPAAVEKLITPRTRAILPVHYTGRVCEMDRLREIADAHNLPIIEDASQAFGAAWRGQPVGTLAHVGCISLNPMKLLAGCGEAGVVLTDDQTLRDRVVALRYNGLRDREDCQFVSMNGRLDTVQAAMLLTRLDHVDALLARRREIARRYNESLADLLDTPAPREQCDDVPYTYTVQTDQRDALKAHLESLGVEVKVYHPKLMPNHAVYRDHARGGPWPNGDRLTRRILCLPVHEKLTDDEVTYVIDAVRSYFENARENHNREGVDR